MPGMNARGLARRGWWRLGAVILLAEALAGGTGALPEPQPNSPESVQAVTVERMDVARGQLPELKEQLNGDYAEFTQSAEVYGRASFWVRVVGFITSILTAVGVALSASRLARGITLILAILSAGVQAAEQWFHVSAIRQAAVQAVVTTKYLKSRCLTQLDSLDKTPSPFSPMLPCKSSKTRSPLAETAYKTSRRPTLWCQPHRFRRSQTSL
jgi:hypothetical protein